MKLITLAIDDVSYQRLAHRMVMRELVKAPCSPLEELARIALGAIARELPGIMIEWNGAMPIGRSDERSHHGAADRTAEDRWRDARAATATL